MTATSQPTPLLLEGIRILDLTRNIAGPVSTMLAAEMGADVIKVEQPGGDEMRTWPPFVDGESVYFVICNRGKRSISLNLKAQGDKDVFLKLLSTADIVVENYRPQTLARMGLDWNDLKANYPRLVWVSVTGYGREGPCASAPAYDSMMQAYTGIMGITGERDGGPVRSGAAKVVTDIEAVGSRAIAVKAENADEVVHAHGAEERCGALDGAAQRSPPGP